jgi:hypothetical protein
MRPPYYSCSVLIAKCRISNHYLKHPSILVVVEFHLHLHLVPLFFNKIKNLSHPFIKPTAKPVAILPVNGIPKFAIAAAAAAAAA